MSKNEQPISWSADQFGKRGKHPAFGKVQVSRVQGSFPNLAGVDYEHSGAIQFTVSEADISIDGDRTHFFEGKHIMRWAMTEVQFAQMISTLNVGDGTPITLEYVRDGAMQAVPPLPKHMHGLEELEQVAADSLKHSVERLRDMHRRMVDMAAAGSIKKGDFNELVEDMRMAVQDQETNLPWRMEQVKKNIAKAADRTKQEVVAFARNVAQQFGIANMLAMGKGDQLAAPAAPAAIEDNSDAG